MKLRSSILVGSMLMSGHGGGGCSPKKLICGESPPPVIEKRDEYRIVLAPKCGDETLGIDGLGMVFSPYAYGTYNVSAQFVTRDLKSCSCKIERVKTK